MPSWKKLIVSGSDASLSSLTTTGKLQLNSSETGSTIFEVNGVNGRLFTITDEMSGSLFNISTTAGLPVIEALSDGKVTLGPFSAQTEINTSGNLELGGNISGSATSTGSFGAIQSAGNITPKVDDSVDLGAADLRFQNVFTTDLQLNNEGTSGNEVDGTTGSWTIQEGEEELYLLNRKNGKKYKFMLQEIK